MLARVLGRSSGAEFCGGGRHKTSTGPSGLVTGTISLYVHEPVLLGCSVDGLGMDMVTGVRITIKDKVSGFVSL